MHNSPQTPCMAVNSSTLTCRTPPIAVAAGQPLTYTLELDNAPFPDTLESALQLMARPDPTGFTLVTTVVTRGSEDEFVDIQVLYITMSWNYIECVYTSYKGPKL